MELNELLKEVSNEYGLQPRDFYMLLFISDMGNFQYKPISRGSIIDEVLSSIEILNEAKLLNTTIKGE